MYKNVLQSIENIAVWPVLSFIIFFLFFICLLWWVLTTDRKFIDTMKRLPLANNATESKSVSETEIEKRP